MRTRCSHVPKKSCRPGANQWCLVCATSPAHNITLCQQLDRSSCMRAAGAGEVNCALSQLERKLAKAIHWSWSASSWAASNSHQPLPADQVPITGAWSVPPRLPTTSRCAIRLDRSSCMRAAGAGEVDRGCTVALQPWASRRRVGRGLPRSGNERFPLPLPRVCQQGARNDGPVPQGLKPDTPRSPVHRNPVYEPHN